MPSGFRTVERGRYCDHCRRPQYPNRPRKLRRDGFCEGFLEQNFGKDTINPLKLLNNMYSLQFDEIFPELFIALKAFLTIPASAASREKGYFLLFTY